ncbi:hypothetical protein AB0I55_22115 [Actinocatenispora sera]|uniref:DUF6197 family protein n=1 Tax=Actinocatenispora sera TaxID=390989 RepID=UPI0033DC7AC7
MDFEQEVDLDEIDAQRHEIEDEQKAEDEAIEVIETLRRAALYIDAHGWYRGDYFNDGTGHHDDPFPPACALGAIGMALVGDRDTVRFERVLDEDDTVNQFARVLDWESWVLGRKPVEIIADWNDEQALDSAEVASMLRAAAEQLASPNPIVRQ